jgi:trk system potassium uptake protein TrkA
MYIIIAGAGLLGREITKILLEHKHDVVVIDKNPEVCESLYAETGATVINGSATNIRTLERAGAEKADSIICLMHHASDNIATALLSKSFKIPQIVARLIDPLYEDAYRQAGVDIVIRVADLLINQILMEIERPKVRKVMTLTGGKAEVYALKVPEAAHVVGMPIREITRQKNFPDECVFMGVYDEANDEFSITRGAHVLKEGDTVFLLSKSQFIKQAAEFLTKHS